MKHSKLIYSLLLAGLFTASAGSLAAIPSYRITSLGDLTPTAINDLGYVVGTRAGNAVLVEPGGFENGLTWPLTYPTAINTSGQLAGIAMGASQQPMSAQSWSLGFQGIGSLGGTWGQAYAINDAGWVVGRSQTASGDMHAFLYSGSAPLVDLGTLTTGAGYESFARGINSAGQVVGYSERFSMYGDVMRVFVAQNGGMTEVSIGGGLGYQYGYDINDKGKVLGRDSTYNWSTYKAFVYDLARNTWAYLPSNTDHNLGRAINNLDQVVGFEDFPDPSASDGWSQYAALWQDNQIYRLDNLIESGAGWVLTDARDINNAGRIVGIGTYNGAQQGFLLTPVPEPETWAMLLLGLGLVGLRLRQGSLSAKRS